MGRTKKWDRRFLRLAREVSTWSKDVSTKVGAVVVRDTNIVQGLGYNGFPRGDADLEEEYLSRETKYEKIVHGEANALSFAGYCVGCTLYTYPMQSCHICAKLVVQSGIKRVVSLESSIERWEESFTKARDLFEKYGLEFVLYPTEFLDI
jgi:dCMP deaminase